MSKSRLFLVCPDCHMEMPIRKQYGDNSFFLTALGTAFDLTDFEFMEEVNQLVIKEDIKEIILVNDHQCTFVKSALQNEVRFNTKAEKILVNIANSSDDIKSIHNQELKSKQISKVNLKRLAFDLIDSAFIGNKISEGDITLTGVIYNKEDKSFQETVVS